MLLLYHKDDASGAPYSVIYIPLCFYFIGESVRVYLVLVHIYIPLCFYFIQEINRPLVQSIRIYIPLCFYFIGSGLTQLRQQSRFTFHYASTLSCPACGRKVMGKSIYIPLCFYFITENAYVKNMIEHLHSTMLLLYHATGGASPA